MAFEQTIECVKHHNRPRIADMRKIIHRGSADIHADICGIERRKEFFLPGQRVVKVKLGHEAPLLKRKWDPRLREEDEMKKLQQQ